jgi:hypothetical protein
VVVVIGAMAGLFSGEEESLAMGFEKGLNRVDNTGRGGAANQKKLELLAFTEILSIGRTEQWQIGLVVAQMNLEEGNSGSVDIITNQSLAG